MEEHKMGNKSCKLDGEKTATCHPSVNMGGVEQQDYQRINQRKGISLQRSLTDYLEPGPPPKSSQRDFHN